MVTENIDIRFRETGARVIKRRIDQIGIAANNATRGIFLLQRALFVLGGAGILRALSSQLDTLTNYENRLRLTAKSAQNLEDVQSRLFEVANRSRTAFSGVAEVYTRAALSTRQLGTSQQELLQFTESLSKATIISGASAREANAALIQLGQGLASDTLRGDELRSVLEQLPFVADVIAEEMTRMGQFGTVTRGELRKLAEDGLISAEIILNAFKNAREEIDELFKQTQVTIGQSFIIAKNLILEFLDRFDDATGASELLARAIIRIAQNIDILVGAAAALAAVMVGTFSGRLIQRVFDYVGGLRAAAVATSRLIEVQRLRAAAATDLLTADAGAAAARVRKLAIDQKLYAETKKLAQAELLAAEFSIRNGRARNIQTGRFVSLTRAKIGLERASQRLSIIESLEAKNAARLAAARAGLVGATNAQATASGRLAAAQAASNTLTARLTRTFPLLAGAASAARTAVASLWAILAANPIGAILSLVVGLTTAFVLWGNEIKVTQDEVVGLKDYTVAAFQLMVEAVKPFAETVGSAIKSGIQIANEALGGLLTVAVDVFFGMLNAAKTIVNAMLNLFPAMIAAIIAAFNALPGSFEQIGKLAINSLIDIIEFGLEQILGGVDDFLTFLGKGFEKIGLENPFADLVDPTIELEKYKFKTETSFSDIGKAASDAFIAEMNKDPIGSALNFILEKASAANEVIIDRARKNIADAAKASTITTGTRTGNKDTDTDGKGKGSSRDRNNLTFEEAIAQIEREIAALRLSNREREIATGLQEIERDIKRGLTEEEIKLADATLRRLQASEDQAKLLEEIQGPQAEYAAQLAAANVLLEEGRISADEYAEALRRIKNAILETDESFKGGFKKSINDAIQTTKEFGESVGSIVVDGVKRAADALVDFAITGKISIRSLVADVITQLAKLATQQLLLGLLGSLVGAPNAAGGGGFGQALAGLLRGFNSGGSILPSGPGTTDSQIVSFKKRPDERVDILTPSQQRERDKGNSGGEIQQSKTDVNLKIANIFDPAIVGDYLQTTEGERVIMNVVRRSGVLEN